MPEIQGFPVIDDTFGHIGMDGTGYESRDYAAYPLCGLEKSAAFADPVIDPSEYKDRIEEKTANKSWISDICDLAGLKVKNQSQSSYCWIHAPVHGMEVTYVMNGGAPKVLSAFYAGSQIKGGRNQGGSGITGLEWLTKHGTCLESFWEPMKFSGNVTPEIVGNAELHQVTKFIDIDASNTQQIITRLLTNRPVTVGIPAWGHEVLLTFLVWDGRPYFGFDNSWGTSYGKNGRGVLSGAKERFDEAGSIETVEMSIQ